MEIADVSLRRPRDQVQVAVLICIIKVGVVAALQVRRQRDENRLFHIQFHGLPPRGAVGDVAELDSFERHARKAQIHDAIAVEVGPLRLDPRKLQRIGKSKILGGCPVVAGRFVVAGIFEKLQRSPETRIAPRPARSDDHI